MRQDFDMAEDIAPRGRYGYFTTPIDITSIDLIYEAMGFLEEAQVRNLANNRELVQKVLDDFADYIRDGVEWQKHMAELIKHHMDEDQTSGWIPNEGAKK